MRTWTSSIKDGAKLSALMAIAGLSMGNKGCEKEVAQDRVLKMEVEIANLKARQVRTPTGEVIDFPYVVNTLFYRQVINHNHFVIMNPVPSAMSLAEAGQQMKAGAAVADVQSPSTSDASAEAQSELSGKDLNLLNRFGFLKQARQDAAAIMSGELSSENAVMGKSTVQNKQPLPACLYEMPQAFMGGEVISFEATWGVGVGIGYSPGGDLAGGVGGRVNFEQSKLELGLRTDDPLTQQPIAIGDGVANQSRTAFGIDFVPGVPVGLNFFFNTPISDVIRTAMTRGLDQMVDRYKTLLSVNRDWNEVWESRVLYDPELVNGDTHIAFRGGYRHGVMIGDTFTATNMAYRWEGAPCYTRLKYKIPSTTTPVAELEVVSVGDNVSVAIVKRYLIEQTLQPGAQIRVMALKKPVAAKSAATSKSKKK
jgi:hypothetical protein